MGKKYVLMVQMAVVHSEFQNCEKKRLQWIVILIKQTVTLVIWLDRSPILQILNVFMVL